MQIYQTKAQKLAGSSYLEVLKRARDIYKIIAAHTKRQPYVRSRYFYKDKIFINSFWTHLKTKPYRDRMRRMQFYDCGIELLRHNYHEPHTKENPNKIGSLLHRFTGMTAQKEVFYVQVEENKKTGNKYLISIFPVESKRKRSSAR